MNLMDQLQLLNASHVSQFTGETNNNADALLQFALATAKCAKKNNKNMEGIALQLELISERSLEGRNYSPDFLTQLIEQQHTLYMGEPEITFNR